MSKSDREIMEILEAHDLTRCAWAAARLAGCDPKTVSRYVAARDLERDPRVRMARPRLAGPYQEKIEEWVERSHGAVRAHVVHEQLRAMGYDGDERATRRAVAMAKQAWVGGRRRTYLRKMGAFAGGRIKWEQTLAATRPPTEPRIEALQAPKPDDADYQEDEPRGPTLKELGQILRG